MTGTAGAPAGAARLGALELVRLVVDPGSWRSWDTALLDPPHARREYLDELAAARARTGLDEAVTTGEGLVEGRRVAVVACDFSFLAGSIGVAASERLVQAVERASAERLPLLAAPTSGGTRMQEGTVAFLQMIKISAAIARHKAAGLPYCVYLRHPTTGGVFASWGSLGHMTAAEPGALVGFLGPRVYETLYGKPFPPGVQTAENLHRHGLIDAVVPAEELRPVVAQALDVLTAPAELAGRPCPPELAARLALDTDGADAEGHPAWDCVLRTRRPDRPGVRDLLRTAAGQVIPMHGTAAGEHDPGLLLALARFGTAPCVLLGQDRSRHSAQTPLGPEGLRASRRGMALAAQLNLPLVSVIDTGGAALSQEAEEGGLAGEIARCLAELVLLPAPTVCLLLGQGAGGGALALLPADRVVAAEHAWLSPLPPEGASAILYRTTDRAPELADRQGVRALDLMRQGIVDHVVPEHPDAADEPGPFLARLGRVLECEIRTLMAQPAPERLAARVTRYRRVGLG